MEYTKGYVYELMDRGGPTDNREPYFREAVEEMMRARVLCAKANACMPDDPAYVGYLEELFGRKLDDVRILTPFICDFGTEIFLAEDVFINYNCTFLDGGGIRIGARTLIAPDCKFYTPNHPMDYLERRKPYERSLGITVGEDCWIGGGSVICPGVTIGNRVVVAAGSVVVDDVPDDVLVAGNPAVVKRRTARVDKNGKGE